MTNAEFNAVFRNRTRKFAVDIFEFLESLPKNRACRIIAYQLGAPLPQWVPIFGHFAEGGLKTKNLQRFA